MIPIINKHAWIECSPWEFVLPSGENVKVEKFFISAEPVSLDLYSDFADRSGYITIAEKMGMSNNYRSNWGLIEGRKRNVSMMTSSPGYLALSDAEAFASYYLCRLPSELEIYSWSLRSKLRPWESISDSDFKGPFIDCTSVNSSFCIGLDDKPLLLDCPSRNLVDWKYEAEAIRKSIGKLEPTALSSFRIAFSMS